MELSEEEEGRENMEGSGEESEDSFIDDDLAEETEEGRQGVVRNVSTRGRGGGGMEEGNGEESDAGT